MSARTIAALSAAGAVAALVPVVLKQVGAIKHLPDPPGKLFDSEAIVTSKRAWPFGVPDGVLGIASFGTTLGLLLADAEWTRCALRWKLVADGTIAGANVVRQVVEFRRICSWCTAAAVLTVPMVCWGWKTAAGQICT